MKFTFLDQNGTLSYDFTTCKEYLQLCVISCLHNRGSGVYDNKYYRYIDFSRTNVLVTIEDLNALKFNIENGLDFLNQFEKELKLPLSTVKEIHNLSSGLAKYPVSYLFDGSPVWFIAPPALALYSLLIREGSHYHKKGNSFRATIQSIENRVKTNSSKDYNWQYEGGSHFRHLLMPTLNVILELGLKKVFGKNMRENWVTASANTGIITFASGELMHRYPSWYKALEKR